MKAHLFLIADNEEEEELLAKESPFDSFSGAVQYAIEKGWFLITDIVVKDDGNHCDHARYKRGLLTYWTRLSFPEMEEIATVGKRAGEYRSRYEEVPGWKGAYTIKK